MIHYKKGITLIEVIIIFVIIAILGKMAEPQHGWRGGIRGKRHREKKCFDNIKYLTSAVETYNIDIQNEESFMKSLNQKILLEKQLIYDNYKCSENGDDYFSYGDLTKDGYIYCDYHGEPTQKFRKSKNFDK